MVIIAGYENELNECFFKLNNGLESRFIWKFYLEPYTSLELYQIFHNKLLKCGWTLENNDSIINWFNNNINYFEFYGRSIEILFTKSKIAHSKKTIYK